MELGNCVIIAYLRIEEIYKEIRVFGPLRCGGIAPAVSDVELLTMEIVGEIRQPRYLAVF